MRRAIVVFLFSLGTGAFAQEQESRLLDRVLKPDMTLANSAQNKQFVAVGQTTAQSVSGRGFGGVRETPAKEYSGKRAFFAWLFGTTREFPRSRTALLARRSEVPQKTFSTRASPLRESSDAAKSVAASGYPGDRPFIAHGKSQKNLDAQRHQMSIDDVRELLNRNK